MQSNIEKLLDYNSEDDTVAEEAIENALEESPQIDIGAVIQRINDLEEKVNALMKNEKETSEEEAIENSEEEAKEETTETETETETETITEEKENDNNDS